jgi:hypothetical protein
MTACECREPILLAVALLVLRLFDRAADVGLSTAVSLPFRNYFGLGCLSW